MGLRGAEVFPFGGMTPLWRIERTLIDENNNLPSGHFRSVKPPIQRFPAVAHALLRLTRTAISASAAARFCPGSSLRQPSQLDGDRPASHPDGVSQFHFDPATYLDLMRSEVPSYERLQAEVVRATEGVPPASVLDLGTGTGETLAAVLARHPGAAATGIDESAAMLDAAKTRLAGLGVELLVADLSEPLPPGPFDLVVSALAVHHLDGPGKAALFGGIADVLRPGGRFVLGDVVIPEDPRDVVTPLSEHYDRPSTRSEQLGWLAESGFDATVTWAERDLVVLRANRPSFATR
jgi:tRNA (cmo5U34)-methyltransferase